MEVSRISRLAIQQATQRTSVRTYSTVHDIPRAAAAVGQAPPPPKPSQSSIFHDAVNASGPRHNWTKEEITEIHQTPLMELAFAAVRATAVNPKPISD